jgi:hypothetical protein
MTLAPPSCARSTKARRTPDLPIPAIPCRQITRVSPRRSSSRARSSTSRPTKGTRRRWETAVAMPAVSPRAPPGARAGSDAFHRPRRAARGARSSGSADYKIAIAISTQSQPPRTQSGRGGQSTPPRPAVTWDLEQLRDRGQAESNAGQAPAPQSHSASSPLHPDRPPGYPRRSLVAEAVAQIRESRCASNGGMKSVDFGRLVGVIPNGGLSCGGQATVVPRLIDAPVCGPVCATASARRGRVRHEAADARSGRAAIVSADAGTALAPPKAEQERRGGPAHSRPALD